MVHVTMCNFSQLCSYVSLPCLPEAISSDGLVAVNSVGQWNYHFPIPIREPSVSFANVVDIVSLVPIFGRLQPTNSSPIPNLATFQVAQLVISYPILSQQIPTISHDIPTIPPLLLVKSPHIHSVLITFFPQKYAFLVSPLSWLTWSTFRFSGQFPLYPHY